MYTEGADVVAAEVYGAGCVPYGCDEDATVAIGLMGAVDEDRVDATVEVGIWIGASDVVGRATPAATDDDGNDDDVVEVAGVLDDVGMDSGNSCVGALAFAFAALVAAAEERGVGAAVDVGIESGVSSCGCFAVAAVDVAVGADVVVVDTGVGVGMDEAG